jgi:putative tricarboxylic transport membrane protein
MNETVNETGGTGPSHRRVEAGVAGVIAGLGLITILGSLRVGVGWGPEGPKAGFFPFYIGLIVVFASAVNLVQVFLAAEGGLFASWAQLRKVVSVLVPTAIYVALIPYTGIYVASALLIAVFMMWLGKYHWRVAIPTAIAVPIFTFAMFEIWFLVPLPKGPLEHLLGY